MKAITIGQKEQCTRIFKDAARKGVEEALAELERKGIADGESVQRILEKGNHVSSEIKNFIKGLLAKEKIAGCLRLISGLETLTLDPTDGTEMIGTQVEVFRDEIDYQFEKYGCNVTDSPTEVSEVQVYDLLGENVSFMEIYDGIGADLDALCLTQGQIINFVWKYRKWLAVNHRGTHFLFKANGEFFVARTGFNFDRIIHRLPSLRVDVRRYSDPKVSMKFDDQRFVLPKLKH